MKTISPVYYFLTILLGIISLKSADAQIVVQTDVIGKPIVTKDFVDIKDSPYTTADWVKGTIKQADGSITKNLLLKYNEVKDEVNFKGENNVAYAFEKPVAEFTLLYTNENGTAEMHYRNGYVKADKNTEVSYYEVLEDGKNQLLRKNIKIVKENKEFGSANITREIQNYSTYYLCISGKIVILKKDKKALFTALAGAHQNELDNYITTHALNLKKDDDLVKLVHYYNTL